MNSRIAQSIEAKPLFKGMQTTRIEAGAEAEEQGNWLVSYLDLMTLLFAFFVLLFAHQKIQNRMMPPEAEPMQVESSELQAEKTETEVLESIDEPVDQMTEQVPEILAQTAEDADQVAVQVMKSQPKLDERLVKAKPKDLDSEVIHALSAPVYEPTVVPFFAAPKQSEIEQTAMKFSSLLVQESAKKQIEIVPEAQEVRLEINDTILFDPGKALLKTGGQAMLERLVDVLNQQQGIISVEGHTDQAPIANAFYPSNWELSAARASAVARFLNLKGIPAERLRAVGMADTKPRESNASLVGRAKNRRVSLAIYLAAQP